MNLKKIKTSIDAAEEFIKRANALKEKEPESDTWFWGSKESSALKRQSMELTRALAELRKPM